MPHTEAREIRLHRQREEGKIAMREYLQNQQQTLKRMADLKAQRLARDNPPSPEEERERKIDEALEETFPASDPPSFVGN
ncbi:MAG: hypothetical protein AB1490_08050 [Pseudomonadota bacterium]